MARPTHGYQLASGARVTGVTTIINRFKESGGLMQWNYRIGREHGFLEGQGLPAPKNQYEVLENEALIGNTAHDMVEDYILGKPIETVRDHLLAVDDADVKRVKSSWEAFHRWYANAKVDIIETETPMVSETHGFGGTLDGLGYVDGRLSLIDWKTSNGVYADYLVQLGAYAILVEENKPELGPIEEYHLLRFSKKHADFKHHSWLNLDEAKEAFLLMRQLYPIMAELKDRAK